MLSRRLQLFLLLGHQPSAPATPSFPPPAGFSILMRSRCYFMLNLTRISQTVMKVEQLFYVGFLTQQITTNFHNLKQDKLMIAQSWRSEFQPGSRWARIRVSAGLCSSRSLQGRICSSPLPASGGAEFPQLVTPPLSSAALSGRVSALSRGMVSLPSHQGFLRTHEKASAPPASPRTISPSQIPT